MLKRCYKVGWGGKMTATQSSTIPLSVLWLKEYSFTLFHQVSWKRTIFEGVNMRDFWDSLVSKVHWGLKNMWKKFWKFAKKIYDLQRNFVQPILSNLPSRAQAFSDPTTRWQPSTSDRLLIMNGCWCADTRQAVLSLGMTEVWSRNSKTPPLPRKSQQARTFTAKITTYALWRQSLWPCRIMRTSRNMCHPGVAL